MQHSRNIIKRFALSRCPAPAAVGILPAKDAALQVELIASARLAACCRKLYTLLLDTGRAQQADEERALGTRHRRRNMNWLKATCSLRKSSTDSNRPKTLFAYLSEPLKSCFEYIPACIASSKKSGESPEEFPSYGRELICSECSEPSADIKQQTEPTGTLHQTSYVFSESIDPPTNSSASETVGESDQDLVPSEQAEPPKSFGDPYCNDLPLSMHWQLSDPEASLLQPESKQRKVTDSADSKVDSSDASNSNAKKNRKCRMQHLRINANPTASKPKNIYKI